MNIFLLVVLGLPPLRYGISGNSLLSRYYMFDFFVPLFLFLLFLGLNRFCGQPSTSLN